MKFIRKLYYQAYSFYLVKKHANYKREKYEDRNVLERIIFPYVLGEFNPKRVLDIGREDYQWFYNFFFVGRELWTLDRKTRRKEFGAEHHIVDDVANLKAHFEDNFFDFVIMNGVFGWGLNDPMQIEQTFDAIFKIMSPGGIFVLGYNDIPDLTPVPIAKIKALKQLNEYVLPPLKSSAFTCVNGDHTYRFYIKK
ncbi:MAG: methyltransferase domain-containing protein [Candidatus Falkowbacteria bacterium]